MSWRDILVDHLDRWEGLRLEAYQDQAGVWTIGWGHTGPDVKPGMSISREQAKELLEKDVAWAASTVEETVKVPINDKMRTALISLTYNIGSGGWRRSTALRRLNAGDYEGCAEAITRWNKVTIRGEKIRSQGLVNRREHERDLFLSGYREMLGEGPKETPPPMPKPGEASGGEQKSLARGESKTLNTSFLGALMSGVAGAAQAFVGMDWRVAVPLLIIGGLFAYLAFNRWLEARRGEH